jgi:hypothetical protein
MLLRRLVAFVVLMLIAIPLAFATHLNGTSSGGPKSVCGVVGCSGVIALQPTSPGVTQTGNANISGTLILGADTTHSTKLFSDANSRLNVRTTATGTTTVLSLQDNAGSAFAWIDTDTLGNSRLMLNPSTASNFPTISVNNNNPVVMTGSGFANGTTLILSTDGVTHTSGKLFDIQNPVTTTKFSVAFDGAITSAGAITGTSVVATTTPIAQTSGGTGAGVLNCAGGPITSNGTAYSCGTPPVGGAGIVYTGSRNFASTTSVSGSLCVATSDTPSLGGAVIAQGMGCIASYTGIRAALAATIGCEVTSATTINYIFCNVGVNTTTMPAGTYNVRIFQ